MSKSKLKVGDTFQTKFGCTYTVIELLPYWQSRIRFNDEFGYEVVSNNGHIRNGAVRNPHYRIAFGRGYFGVGQYKSTLDLHTDGITKEYRTWMGMFKRCYAHDKPSCYDIAEVCDDWWNLQTFSTWFSDKRQLIELNEPEIKYSIDKDILGEGSKLYSSETSCLVPAAINSVLISCSKVMIGEFTPVSQQTSNGTYWFTFRDANKVKIRVSGLKSQEECKYEYMIRKKLVLIELANKYKHVIEQNVYDKLTESWDHFLFKSPVGLSPEKPYYVLN